MISLSQYLLESIVKEGGHAVEASPIPSHLALPMYEEIKSKLILIQKDLTNKIAVLGSVGKKKLGDFNGDIDIAVEYDRSKFEDILKKAIPDAEYAKSSMPNIISINYPFDNQGVTQYGQVDFMIVDDLEWAEFIYSSPNFIEDESRYKAALRNHLLSIMISEIPVDEQPQYNDAGEIETKWKYSLNFAFGVTKQLLDYRGKNGLLKNPKKLKEFEQIITKNKKAFIDLLFEKGDDSDFKSLETVWKALHSKYKYRGKIKDIEYRFFVEVLERNGLDKNEFLELVK